MNKDNRYIYTYTHQDDVYSVSRIQDLICHFGPEGLRWLAKWQAHPRNPMITELVICFWSQEDLVEYTLKQV